MTVKAKRILLAEDEVALRDFVSRNLRVRGFEVLEASNGVEVRLSPTEFALLKQLITNAGKVLTHRMLLQSIWGPEYGGEAEYLRVYINRLRQKLEPDPANPRYLLTEPGVGYRFVAPESEGAHRRPPYSA